MKVKTLKIFGNEKIPVRIGYMGAGMILAAHWTLEPLLFICGFSCVLVQVTHRKQWNLVVLNINLPPPESPTPDVVKVSTLI